MNNHIKELCQEAHEILNNIHNAVMNGTITQEQADEIRTMLLEDLTAEAGLLKLKQLEKMHIYDPMASNLFGKSTFV